jgi:hypothetical protein
MSVKSVYDTGGAVRREEVKKKRSLIFFYFSHSPFSFCVALKLLWENTSTNFTLRNHIATCHVGTLNDNFFLRNPAPLTAFVVLTRPPPAAAAAPNVALDLRRRPSQPVPDSDARSRR